jgi:hypothetical protein
MCCDNPAFRNINPQGFRANMWQLLPLCIKANTPSGVKIFVLKKYDHWILKSKRQWLINFTNALLNVVWLTVDTHDILRGGSIPLSDVWFFFNCSFVSKDRIETLRTRTPTRHRNIGCHISTYANHSFTSCFIVSTDLWSSGLGLVVWCPVLMQKDPCSFPVILSCCLWILLLYRTCILRLPFWECSTLLDFNVVPNFVFRLHLLFLSRLSVS